MPNDIEAEVKAMLKEGLTDTLTGLLNEEEDADYLEEKTCQIARQAALMACAAEGKRDEHERNIRHLMATIQSAATVRYIKLYSQGQDAFIAVLDGLIKLSIRLLLSA